MHIGVDVGTSGTKACAFDENGALLAQAACDYDFADARNGRREIDPVSIGRAALDTLSAVAARLKADGRGAPRSVTVSSLGEAVVPLDENGDALGNFLSGTDSRGEEEARAFAARLGDRALAAATGVSPGGLFSYGKIAWMKAHRPEVFDRARLWLNVQDYVVRLLSGEAVMDRSIASRTMMYDVNGHRWWRSALEELGLREARLPRVEASGALVGTLRPQVAFDTGLPTGMPVVVGAHDHIANAIGCGVTRPGWATNATGTTEGITALMDERMDPEDILRCNISCEPFAVPGMHCTVAWHNTAGALLKWFRREFGREDDGGFAGLDRKCPPGPTRLLILPHFSGGGTPDFDAASKGAVLGLTLGTTKFDLYKALMEGATFELRRILDAMDSCGLKTDQLVVCGGGAKSGLWLQMKSDILQKEVRLPLHEHNGALGCGIMGAVACRDYADLHEAAQAMGGSGPVARPNPENVKIYGELMEQYRTLYRLLAPVHHALTGAP